MQEIAQLVDEIESAWSCARPPQASDISTPTYDDEGVSAYFAGKTWQGHSAKMLRVMSFAPGVLTNQAFAYFLPAYMKADLEEPDVADTIVESLLFGLAWDGERRVSVVALLNRAQKLALAKYIRHVHQREDGLYEADCHKILQLLER
jgi:hypothetical protein